MLYYLSEWLVPYFGPFNVLTYNTVRAGGAAFTAFVLCVLAGPFVIEWLRRLKFGQYIKREHVADLHALHQRKAGTPTMGGVLLVGASVLALLLWGDLSNRLLWVAMLALLTMGMVGFLDDYLKILNKHNDGLSARAKLVGQVTLGLLLGAYLYWQPVTLGDAFIVEDDVRDWGAFSAVLARGEAQEARATLRTLWSALPEEQRESLRRGTPEAGLERRVLLDALNDALQDPTLFPAAAWASAPLDREGARLLARGPALPREVARLNRLTLAQDIPGGVLKTTSGLHSKLGVPGLKEVFIPLGLVYIVFVIGVITATSNAVNVTDGLDGLAAGTASISILAFTGIAYVVSRADWSSYLFLVYVPGATEVFVFGAALLGAGLGFLWFNAHPAEVFMGDTGSLALGGAIGTMALLTKQELLLPIVAGLFVIEAGSVMLQVGSYKLTGKRVFRMAPLHHHFELAGWSETKVVARFYIIAILCALMSLATLKLR